MSATAERTCVTVRLAAGCASEHCLKMAGELHAQLRDDYRWPVSALDLAQSWSENHRTARKRAGRAERLGYTFAEIDRHEHEADIYEINTSATERQGRPMSSGYLEQPTYGPNPIRCQHHHVYTYGVHDPDGLLAAYLWLYRAGQLALVSSILGHADRLADDVMYLLVRDTIARQKTLGGVLAYNLHTSGTDGLRYFKERLGFQPAEVTWTL